MRGKKTGEESNWKKDKRQGENDKRRKTELEKDKERRKT